MYSINKVNTLHLMFIPPFNFLTTGSKEPHFSFQSIVIINLTLKCRLRIAFCGGVSVCTYAHIHQVKELWARRPSRLKWMWVLAISIGRYMWKFQVLRGRVLSLDCVYPSALMPTETQQGFTPLQLPPRQPHAGSAKSLPMWGGKEIHTIWKKARGL